jgi:hypothetical protein
MPQGDGEGLVVREMQDVRHVHAQPTLGNRPDRWEGLMTQQRDVFRQGLQRRVTSELHLGRLRPGERLASARQTARTAGTDYRQVVTALRGLERDGLVEIRPRGGIYAGCRSTPARATLAGGVESAGFGDRLADFVLAELAGGLSVGAVAERLRRCLDTAGLRVACIECNGDQLDFLAQELRAGFGLESQAVEIDQLRRDPPVAVRQAHLLVSTSFHAGEVRRCAARLRKAAVIVTLDPRRRADVTRRLARGPVYFIGTDPRWAVKARTIWAGEPGAERLRVLTLGRDALEDVPADAAVMLMPRARRLLAGTAWIERALPARGFSVETGRAIVSFLLSANAAAPGAGRRA